MASGPVAVFSLSRRQLFAAASQYFVGSGHAKTHMTVIVLACAVSVSQRPAPFAAGVSSATQRVLSEIVTEYAA